MSHQNNQFMIVRQRIFSEQWHRYVKKEDKDPQAMLLELHFPLSIPATCYALMSYSIYGRCLGYSLHCAVANVFFFFCTCFPYFFFFSSLLVYYFLFIRLIQMSLLFPISSFSRLIPANTVISNYLHFNFHSNFQYLHFKLLLQITNKYVKQKLFFNSYYFLLLLIK